MIINISDSSDYHTQINNEFVPYGTCNTTSMINGLNSTGVKYSYPQNMQPEDYLTQLTESEAAWNKMRKEYPWAIKKGYHPRHVHAVLAWVVNEFLVKRKVVVFREDATMQEILYHIAVDKSAVVVNGRFTDYGHIVTIVGMETRQGNIKSVPRPEDIDLESILHIIIDDPYGNYHTGYQDQRGNDVYFTLKDLNWILKEYNRMDQKLAHFIFK